MLEKFINAIHARQKISLTFYSHEDSAALVRTCAPLDYGPSRRAKDKSTYIDCTGVPGDYEWHLSNPVRLDTPLQPQNRPQPVWFKPFILE